MPKTVVLFSTADWDEPYWTNKQHSAQMMSSLGYDVIYIESTGLRSPKVGSKKDLNRIANRLFKGLKTIFWGASKKNKNLKVISPFVLPKGYKFKLIDYYNNKMLSWLINREVKCPSNYTVIWTYHPFIIDTIKYINHEFLLYHCVDDLSKIPGIDPDIFISQEDNLLKIADKVYTTTETLLNRCEKINNTCEFLPNVVDFEHFSQAFYKKHIPYDIECIPEPRCIYHGVLSDFKVDFGLLYYLAVENPDKSFVIIGREREGQLDEVFNKLQKLNNVYSLGYIDYESLPDYLAFMHVGLLPTLVNEYTYSMFPMKYFEYVASGLPVVSTDIKFCESIERERIAVAKSREEFSSKIIEQLERGKLSIEESKLFVGNNTWKTRTIKMLSSIDRG